jgi:crotonobetainyl-CoA:carnitine CoA-transferase CaiB-like acyl-CoA transferase
MPDQQPPEHPRQQPHHQPLSGVVVLDCSQILAGPFCTMHLSDMGADVIKVEKPGGGDDVRGWGPFAGGESVPFMQLNRNKRSIVLDLRDDRGKEALRRLAARSDILIENYRPGTMERLGLGYDDLSRGHPELVYCSISGFGKTGPYAKRAGFDLVAQGMSGIMGITGYPGMPPVKAGIPVADLNAGMFALFGILTAYVHRLRTGRGQYLETSLLEAALTYTVWESAIYLATGQVAGPLGSTHRLTAPYQALRTADGFFNVGAANQPNWERLCDAIKRPELLTDPRFVDNAARMSNLRALETELERTFTTRPTSHWLKVLDDAGIPAGPIYDMAQVWADQQVRARDMDVVTDHPKAGKVHNIGVAVKLAGTPGRVRSAAPYLGQHTDEVLGFAGYSADEIRSLRAAGVAGVAG